MKDLSSRDLETLARAEDALDFGEPMPDGVTVFECGRGPRRRREPPPVPRGKEVALAIDAMPRPLKPPGKR